MDYKELMADFRPLDTSEVPVFGSPRETERAVFGYNRMLEQFKNGNDDIARIALEKIAHDYPMFVEAKHMYALSLASERRYGKAEKLLRELLLLDLNDAETSIVETQLAAVHKAGRAVASERRKNRIENDQLLPVRARMATASILQPASGTQIAGMASEKEIDEIMKRIERGETVEATEIEDLRPAVRKKTGPVLFLLALILVVLAAVFMLFIRPAQLERTNEQRKLFYLEQQLKNNSELSEDIRTLREAYEQFVRELK